MNHLTQTSFVQPGPKNRWRLEIPRRLPRWSGRLDPTAADKLFIVSCDSHANEPAGVWSSVDSRYKDRLPHIRTDEDGTQWLVTEGNSPQPIRIAETRTDLMPPLEEYETWDAMTPYARRMEDQDIYRARCGRSLQQRIADRRSQGVDAELIFPTQGLLAFATPDVDFSFAMARAWNRWAKDEFGSDAGHSLPMALLPVADVEQALDLVDWAASNGFKGFMISNRPRFHRLDEPRHPLEYNDKMFEPLWSAIEETGLPITLHVATGQDPRAVHGNGGALINYACHALTTTVEPIVQLISSGVFERHPRLRVGTIESGIGWIPYILNQLDHAYRAHHMWMRPIIPDLPSDYFKRNCFATFMEEKELVDFCLQLGLEDNLVWASDYPHNEGSFPHCVESMRRVTANATETQAAKILGLNAVEIFKIGPHV